MAAHDQPGCLGVLFKLLGLAPQGPGTAARLPYRRKDYLLTRAEGAFFDVLSQAAADEYWVFAKVRLEDVLWLPKGTEARQTHRNRVQSKHVDFLLCDRAAIRPVLAIELDDSSHQRQERRQRDVFLDQALRDAQLPLMRLPAQRTYNAVELRRQIHTHIVTGPR